MKKIVIIHQSAELYGSDKMLLLFLTHLDNSKFFVVVILPSSGPLQTALEQLGLEVHLAPVLKIYRNIVKPNNLFQFSKQFKSSLRFLETLHKKHHFDVVYSNTLAVLLGMFFARKHKIKHLWHVHEIVEHPKIIAQLFPKLLNKYADVVVCNSLATQNNLVQRQPALKFKTRLVYNGLETQKSQASNATKTDFGFSNNDTVVTLVGRISRLKGHQWVLQTIVNELSDVKNLVFLFVGSPVSGQEIYLENVQTFIKNHQLEAKVKILPFSEHLADIWTITNIALMPSTEAESFGLVAAEAMLAQKPVIATNLGGLKEIIVPNETGFLVAPYHQKELKEAILNLHQNPKLQSEIGKNARTHIQNNFDIQQHVLQLEQLLDKF